MTQPDDLVIIGKIGASYGVKGWVKIHSFTEHVFDILNYTPWYIEIKKGWEPVEINASQQHGNGIIVKLNSIQTPEEARWWAGKHIATPSSQLPPLNKGEYYWKDLKGLTVINQKGQSLGTVTRLIETGGNDVLVVKGEKEQAIPYLPDQVIKEVDLMKRIIYVDWDE